MSAEPWVVHATLRETIEDEIPIECRFSDGQKFAAITVDDAFPELASRVLASLYGFTREDVEDERAEAMLLEDYHTVFTLGGDTRAERTKALLERKKLRIARIAALLPPEAS